MALQFKFKNQKLLILNFVNLANPYQVAKSKKFDTFGFIGLIKVITFLATWLSL